MELTKKQRAVLGVQGHMLVTGGPGSGKTTIAILKAADTARNGLAPSQNILFLSFFLHARRCGACLKRLNTEQQIPQGSNSVLRSIHSFILLAHFSNARRPSWVTPNHEDSHAARCFHCSR